MNNAKERHNWYISHGLCPKCGGKNQLQKGYKLCLECRMKGIEAQRKARAMRTEEQRTADSTVQKKRDIKRREERKAQGLCPECGKHKPTDGYKYCAYCRAKGAARKRKAKRESGSISMSERTSGWYCYMCCAELHEWRENKLCDSCKQRLQEQAERMRGAIDYENHPFSRAEHIRYEEVHRRGQEKNCRYG